jgi:hypothetical protein
MPAKGQYKEYCKRGHKRTPENLYSDRSCRQCSRESSKNKIKAILRWEKTNPEEHAKKMREWTKTESGRRSVRNTKLKKNYGITLEQYEAMLKAQDNKCAICGLFLIKPHIDHNHTAPKQVRGILCDLCNPGLGYFQDNPELLIKAAKYLKKWSSK